MGGYGSSLGTFEAQESDGGSSGEEVGRRLTADVAKEIVDGVWEELVQGEAARGSRLGGGGQNFLWIHKFGGFWCNLLLGLGRYGSSSQGVGRRSRGYGPEGDDSGEEEVGREGTILIKPRGAAAEKKYLAKVELEGLRGKLRDLAYIDQLELKGYKNGFGSSRRRSSSGVRLGYVEAVESWS